ncbi:MAG: PPOX class F420-dependent oxidoreductase [Dehalococcoidia bacterium]|nr:PPOX class F420-dependent oxidoreductase [Dehalococcoidia bacterium]
MAITLTEKQRKLLTEGKNFAHVATIMPDGSPQVTPVWVDFDGRHILFNTEEKRVKLRNLRRDPRVTLSVLDMGNPYDFVEFRGRVVEMTTEGADAHIDAMAKKYLGQETYPFSRPGDVRVIVKIEVTAATG